MNRSTKLQHLEEAQRNVEDGARHIIEQEQRIAPLDRDGHDTREARRLLETFREIQEQHVKRRDPILRELGQ